jgi:hypothetical protein
VGVGRVKRLKQVEKCCFNFHDALYCCVKYSNVECQYEIFKLLIKSNTQKQMLNSNFGREFHDLKYFELDFFSSHSFHFYKLEVTINYVFAGNNKLL